MDLVPRNTERTSSKLPPTLPSSMSSASNRKSFNKLERTKGKKYIKEMESINLIGPNDMFLIVSDLFQI
ncbi:hypothetical protein QR98_0079040 [Sarcoptes scabiei]|uniref:Uncharacterized protein n=1 Tax=Sarcoptes scabiei TaxID=52283 RepID=A0A132AG00_SARSC|nr:hypothetical protein QR98_0079040 [Sarcoptes scabiei]